MEQFVNFFLQYKSVFIFYAIVIAFVIWKKKQIDFQAKIIMLYRTKFGLKAMDKFIAKYREWVILVAYVGVGVGYIGLVVISYFLIANLVKLIFSSDVASGVSLVLPGVNVPGLGILPFWYWLIAIFMIALIHEFGHGIVARAHDIKVRNTGLVLLGPIIGAFVEPDEKQMSKQKDIVQYSVMAAGPFANIILAVVALLILSFITAPLQGLMTEDVGFSFTDYVEGEYPAEEVGLEKNTIIKAIDGQEVDSFQPFAEALFCKSPGDDIIVSSLDDKGNEVEKSLTLAANPDDEQKTFLGIIGIQNEVIVKEKYTTGAWSVLYYILDWINGFLKWLYILSLGIGLFNLLPLPIVDGGRMVQVSLQRIKGAKKGNMRYGQIGMFFLLVLLLNLFYPLIRNVFSSLV